jgi:hypothetical protein
MCSFAFVVAEASSTKPFPRILCSKPSHREHRMVGFPFSFVPVMWNISATLFDAASKDMRFTMLIHEMSRLMSRTEEEKLET